MRKLNPTRHLIPLVLVLGLLGVSAAPATATPRYRIIGGAGAAIESFPYTAALVARGSSPADGQFCGGSVISPSAVLTAAHCVEQPPSGGIDVVTGRTRLSDSAKGQRTPVSRVTVYPGYDSRAAAGDAAVLTLSRPVAAPPVAIAAPGDSALTAAGRGAAVAGWGLTTDRGSPVDSLRAVGVTVHANSTCSRGYGSDFRPALMLCAGGAAGDSCQGDSGGPLVTPGDDGRLRQIGVVSFGGEQCADASTPGMYSRVTAMSAWISGAAALGPAAPAAPAPPRAPGAPLARFGRISCGAVRCRIEVRLARESGVGSIRLSVRRGSLHRLAVARRVAPGRWVANVNLPYGVVRLSAAPLTPAGKRTGRLARLTIEVS